jgi:TolB-like protein/DNA-binding winged helix-turn-helix (wHTH) protein/Tfp pilus assembly protein PilF
MDASARSPRRVIRFDSFEVDVRAGELRRDGTTIGLQQQPLRVLTLLLERAGDVVTREELREAIWPAGSFVESDEGIDAAVYKLRSALGDSAEYPRFVETLPRRGYRFIGAVDPPETLGRGATGSPVEDQALRAGSKHRSLVVTAGLAGLAALLLAASVGGLRDRLRGQGSSERIHSLAVLPLGNLSGDPEQDYFAEGMTEALITRLGGVGGLRVISHTSTMHYKDAHETLPEIARQLNVDAIVEGAVLRVGQRVRITAQLVQASTDRHLWAETYERDVRDVLALQDEVARAISNEIQVRLSPRNETRWTDARPVNSRAYEAYLKGRHELNEWTDQGLKRSLGYFEQAIREDSSYAPAWAGLSDAYGLLSLFGFLPPQLALPKAKEAALRAIDLDETLSEAHVSLSGVSMHLEWSWSAAERELRRAIALNPNNAMAHQWYGYLLSATGGFDAALAEMKRALQLDPLSANKQNALAATFYRAGRYDEALHYFSEVPDPDANSETRHRRMAAIYERKGMLREALAELLTALRLAGKQDVAASVERTYLSSGYPEAKKTFLVRDLLETQRRATGTYPRSLASDIAADYALLGEQDKAVEWLETAVRDREGPLMYLEVDDRFEAVRSDVRYRDIARRIGLVPEPPR